MANHLAWSHSRRKTFLECPKQLYHTQIAKKGTPDRVEFVQSQAMLDGNLIDDALTKRIGQNTPLPAHFAQWEGVCQVVLNTPGAKFTQLKLALDAAYRPCSYNDWTGAWVRVIYDVAIVNGTYAFLGDWKNGMIVDDPDQLKLFAAVGFHHYNDVQDIDTSYIWLKHGQMGDASYNRRELPDLWAAFIPDVERMQVAYKTNTWPATPQKGRWGWNCKRCAVNKAGLCKEAAVPYQG